MYIFKKHSHIKHQSIAYTTCLPSKTNKSHNHNYNVQARAVPDMPFPIQHEKLLAGHSQITARTGRTRTESRPRYEPVVVVVVVIGNDTRNGFYKRVQDVQNVGGPQRALAWCAVGLPVLTFKMYQYIVVCVWCHSEIKISCFLFSFE